MHHRVVRLLAALALLTLPAPALAQEVNAALRGGIYSDSDYTSVVRSLVAVDARISKWRLSAHESVDVVTSASIDVRAATGPAAAGKARKATPVDAVTAATRSVGTPVPIGGGGGGTASPEPTVSMSDKRYETVLGGGYDDGTGHTASASMVYATENDYRSVGGGLRGSYDLGARNTTLLGGVNVHHDLITSVLDPGFAATSDTLGYSAGVAQVVGADDVLRLRYDGTYVRGYQGSPYRTVRFGDWYTVTNIDGSLTFMNTMGGSGGLAERLPAMRLRHAAVAQWVHALGDGVGLASEARIARDSWGILGGSVGTEVRAVGDEWTFRAGYRFYAQTRADFFQDKYLAAPESYALFTSDKSLGTERDHEATIDVGYISEDWPATGIKTVVDGKVDFIHFDYPGFSLLESRTSWYIELGVSLSL